jgi:hypothetical protein
MGFKVRFEAELDQKLKDEMDMWGLKAEDVVRDGMEHSLWGAIRRKTDNLCRKCKKPIEASIPLKERSTGKFQTGFCRCR